MELQKTMAMPSLKLSPASGASWLAFKERISSEASTSLGTRRKVENQCDQPIAQKRVGTCVKSFARMKRVVLIHLATLMQESQVNLENTRNRGE